MSDERFAPEASDHERFDELAAGYALDALEADDEREFQAHLEHCERCQILVAEFGEVAAELASASPDALARPELGDEIVATARRSPRRAMHDEQPVIAVEASPPARVAPLDGHRARRRSRMLVAVAAAVIIVGGILGGLFASQGGIGAPPTKCTRSTGCTEITLTSLQTHRAAARVIVARGSVWLRPVHLSPDARARQIYVLWQIQGSHSPRAIGGFDVIAGHQRALAIGALVAPSRHDTSFAISLEPGRQLPPAPTHVVAVERLT